MATASDVNIKIKSFIGATNTVGAIFSYPPQIIATTATLDGAILSLPNNNYGVLRIDPLSSFDFSPSSTSNFQMITLYNDGGAALTIDLFYFSFSQAVSRQISPVFTGTVAQNLINNIPVTIQPGTTASFYVAYKAVAPGDYVNSLIFYSDAQNSEYQIDTYQHVTNALDIQISTTTFITNTVVLGLSTSTTINFNKNLNSINYSGAPLELIPTIVGDPGWTVTTGTFNAINIVWDPDQVNNTTGTYVSTITVAVYELGQYLGYKNITNISYVNIDYSKYANLISWISPASSYNSIIGISADIVDSQYVLTIGVGLGGDFSPQYGFGGYNLANSFNLGFRARTIVPKFPYWANVWSFVLNQYPYTYYSGELDSNDIPKYIRKTTTSYNYEKYFGYEQSLGYQSMFIVTHDGAGNIRIAINNLRELTGNLQFDTTLKNLTRAFHYYSSSDINTRYYQLDSGPIGDGTRTQLFRGIDTIGSLSDIFKAKIIISTSIVSLPDNIV